MADDKDVLGKADALLRRHQVGADTGGVPVLTERFEPAPAPAPPPPAAAELSDEERAIVDRVVLAIEARLASELERQVTHELSPRLDEAIEKAIAGLRDVIQGTVAQAVREALKAGPLK